MKSVIEYLRQRKVKAKILAGMSNDLRFLGEVSRGEVQGILTEETRDQWAAEYHESGIRIDSVESTCYVEGDPWAVDQLAEEQERIRRDLHPTWLMTGLQYREKFVGWARAHDVSDTYLASDGGFSILLRLLVDLDISVPDVAVEDLVEAYSSELLTPSLLFRYLWHFANTDDWSGAATLIQQSPLLDGMYHNFTLNLIGRLGASEKVIRCGASNTGGMKFELHPTGLHLRRLEVYSEEDRSLQIFARACFDGMSQSATACFSDRVAHSLRLGLRLGQCLFEDDPVSPAFTLEDIFDSDSELHVYSAGIGRLSEAILRATVCTLFDESRENKSQIQLRLHNALQLATEAVGLRNELRLALFVSALEALLLAGKSELSTQLAQNAAALLEPDAKQRLAAVKCIKKIYSLRSSIIHGEKKRCTTAEANRAEMLFAAVFCAYVQRMEFDERGEFGQSGEDLIAEMQIAFASGGAVLIVGDEPLPVRRLWQES